MADQPTEIRILTVTDDPSAPRELERTLNDEAVRTLFADTGNAVTRTFDSDRIDLVVIHVDGSDPNLLETVIRSSREQDHFVPVIALVDEEDTRAAQAVAGYGVEGFASQSNMRQLKRLTANQVTSLRARIDAKVALRSLSDIEDRYTLLLDSSSEAIAYIHEGLHIYANRAYLELFGFEAFDELEGLSMLDLLSPTDEVPDLKKVLKALTNNDIPDHALILNAHRQDGTAFTASVAFSPARYGGEYCAQMLVREQVSHADPELEEELRKLKTSDLLTGLFNSTAFIRELTELVNSREDPSGLAVMAVSLDNHDELLEKVGVGATDDLVRETGELLRSAAEEALFMGRLRDHTFALVADTGGRAEAEQLAGKIVERTTGMIIDVRDTSLTVSGSVGLALAGSSVEDPESLIEHAESALKEALRAGGNGFVRYRPRISAEGEEDDSAWAERLRHALDHNEFGLVTSPITSMEDDTFLINEVESRLRPEDSDEVILPAAFLDAASRTGLAPKLDTDTLDRVQKLLADRKSDTAGRWLVPLTLASMIDESFGKELCLRLDRSKLEPERVIFGFREPEIRDKLRQTQGFIDLLADYDCQFALCDVEPDAPVETLLRHLDVRYLRLAPEATQNLSGDESLREQLSTLVSDAREHDVRVIAPQVENTGDLATLWQFGITLVQGEFVREQASA